MALTPGTRLGPYDIVGALGAGGMAEVYRARDTRLDRSVALKVLPAEVASDPDRRARFEREARAIAALSHPNICIVHDVGRATIAGAAAPVDYLVMEHLEGDTLADRLARSQAPLSVEDTIDIAGDIAAALDAAHRTGIVHRDLKPANVMLTKSGAKLLDFGIAKWLTPQEVGGQEFSTTVSGDTAHGMLVGSVHYMAPEQVEGHPADARSDIWACGVVLYEMCTGRRPFDGESTASVIGAILKDSPEPMTVRRAIVPAVLDRIVSRCLQKDPGARWQSAADVRAALDLVAPGTADLTASAARMTSAPAPRRWQWVGAAVVGAGVIFGAGAFLGQRMRPPASLPQLVQFDVAPPADAMFSPAPVAGTAQFALSPDGRHLAFVAARRRGVSQIYVRSLDALEARPLAATDGAAFPFWSPDSQSIGFFAGGKLKKVAITGGVQVLADAPAGRGGAWSPDGAILFSPTPNGQIYRVPSSGGAPSPVTAHGAVSGEDGAQVIGHNWPAILPDGRFVFYQRAGNVNEQGIAERDAAGRTSALIMASDGLALYSSGHLLLVRDGTLIAQPLEGGTLRPVGEPARIADGIGYFRGSFGHSAIAATPGGALAYAAPIATVTRLRWVDRSGSRFVDAGNPAPYVSPRLSLDGRTVAVAITGGTMDERDVWLLDVARNTVSRATSDPSADWFPAWAPDGGLFFGSTRTGLTTMFHKAGVQQETRVDDAGPRLAVYPHDVSSDGRLIVNVQSATRGYDIGVTTLGTPPVWTAFLSTNFSEVQPRFSPDRRWIAYASDESGRFEIYVRPYPASDAQWQISSGGGMQPEWRRDGKELYYVSSDGKMMAVSVTLGARTLEAGTPQALFDVETPEAVAPYPNHYAVTPDGQRFLVNTVIDQPSRPAITVMLNWPRVLPSRPK